MAGINRSHFLPSPDHEPRELGSRHVGHRAADLGELVRQAWLPRHRRDLAIEARHDRLRHARRRGQPEPGLHPHLRPAELGGGRHVGKHRVTGRAGLRQHAQLAALRDPRAGEPHRHQVDLPGDGVGRRLRAAAIGHVHDVGAGRELEHLDRDVQRPADAAAAVAQLARVGLGVPDQLGQRLRRHVRIDREHRPRRHHQRDRREVLHRIVAIALLQERQHRRFRGGDHQRVAVGRRPVERVGADLGHAARPIVDHDRLAEARAQFVGEQAAHDVDQAAGRRRDDQPDRACRIVLRLRRRRRQCRARRR